MSRGRKAKYPWDGMLVGSSFVVDTNPLTMRALCHQRKVKHGHKYSVHKEGDGCRVTRVE
jgi:hypothetical protein